MKYLLEENQNWNRVKRREWNSLLKNDEYEKN